MRASRKSKGVSILVAFGAITCVPTFALPANPEKAEPQSRPATSPPEPVDSETAKRMLEALQRAKPSPEIIPPASASLPKPPRPPKPLWAEGAAVVDRTGTLFEAGGWWMFRWSDSIDEPPVKLLPNATLEQMIRTVDDNGPTIFSVSGELTAYQAENFLLPMFATRGAEATSKKPSETVPVQPTAEGPSMEDIIDSMKSAAQPRALPPTSTTSQRSLPQRRESVLWAPLADGTPMVNRPGRVVQSGPWWTLVFESDQPAKPEPPMRLLPNRVLESMTRASERGAAGLVFVVSGEITAFRGENYLLARVAVRRAELGNLSK